MGDEKGKGAAGTGSTGREARMVQVRMRHADLQRIDQRAREAGLSRSAYMRRAGLSGGPLLLPHEHELLIDMRQDLSGVGNNVNQLAKLANTFARTGESGERLEEDVRKALADVYDVRRRLEEAVRILVGEVAPRVNPGGDA